jgi:hypothetical protein
LKTKKATLAAVGLAAVLAVVLALVLLLFYRLHKELAIAIGLGVAALLLIGELLEPFAWLAGLTRRK